MPAIIYTSICRKCPAGAKKYDFFLRAEYPKKKMLAYSINKEQWLVV